MTREEELLEYRAKMRQIREKLGMDGIVKIFERDLTDEDQRFHELIRDFDEVTYKPCIVELEAFQMPGEGFLQWFNQKCQENGGQELLHNSPDHWATSIDPVSGNQCAIETMFSCTMPMMGELHLMGPEGPAEEPVYPIASYGTLYSPYDGKPLYFKSLHQFLPTEQGVKCRLGIYLPHTYPDEWVKPEQWHLAIEWQNWFEMMYADYGKKLTEDLYQIRIDGEVIPREKLMEQELKSAKENFTMFEKRVGADKLKEILEA